TPNPPLGFFALLSPLSPSSSLSLTSLAAGLTVDLSLALRLKVVALCFRRCSVTVAALSRSVASESVEFEPIPIGSCSKENQSIYQQLFKLRRFSKALPYGVTHASKALEPATLVPLQLLKSSGTKCIMVGDPKQLSATVLSNVASKYLYECSMFERLQRAGHPVIMLTKQRTTLLGFSKSCASVLTLTFFYSVSFLLFFLFLEAPHVAKILRCLYCWCCKDSNGGSTWQPIISISNTTRLNCYQLGSIVAATMLAVHCRSKVEVSGGRGKPSRIVDKDEGLGKVPPVELFPNCLVQQKVLHPFRKQGNRLVELFCLQNLQKREDRPLTSFEGTCSTHGAIRNDFTDLTSPHTWYPQARRKHRRIILHVGPTNSGKTHQALSQVILVFQVFQFSSAFMIGGRKLITNAHCVEHDTQVKVKRRGDDTKYVAKVLARGVDCDIALLSVESDELWRDVEPLRLGRLSHLQ
ncbi:hypothetical protein S245_047375, partial [Arachis hypogaea]